MPGESGPGTPSPSSAQRNPEVPKAPELPQKLGIEAETSRPEPTKTLQDVSSHAVLGDKPVTHALGQLLETPKLAAQESAMGLPPEEERIAQITQQLREGGKGIPTSAEFLRSVHMSMDDGGTPPEPPTEPERGSLRDRLRGLRGAFRRETREFATPRPRAERRAETQRRENAVSFQGLNQQRVEILERVDAAGNLSPEDQTRIIEIYQQMDNLALEARNLVNFTTEGNLLDPNVRVRNLQEAQIRQQDLPARYNGALRHYIDAEIRVAQEQAPAVETAPQFSQFQQHVREIERLRSQGVPDTDPGLTHEIIERDRLLGEANQYGLFELIKDQVFLLYREARIDVTPSEKRYRLSQILQEQQRAEVQSQETTVSWAELEARGIQYSVYGGTLDYVHRGSLSLVRGAIENPKSPVNQESGVAAVWNYTARDQTGRIRPETINNFNHLRQAIENERKERPRSIGNRGDYLFPIAFIVDGVEELEEAVDDTLIRLEKEVLSGGLELMAKGLQERQGYGQKAMEAFMREFNLDASHPTVLKATSKLNSVSYALGAAIFEGLGKKGFKNYLDFFKAWAEGFRTEDVVGKEINVHYLDSIYFDKDGMMALGLSLLEQNDGEFWRYGSNSVKPPTKRQRDAYQKRRRAEFVEFMTTHKLKPVDELLRTHPTFQALKVKSDRRDPSGQQWQEYSQQAKDWEDEKIKDGTEPDPVIKFEHPLARKLSEAGFKDMYEQIRDPAVIKSRKERAEVVLKRAERLATVLMIDSNATSARLKLKDANGNETGEVKPFATIARDEVMKIVEKDAQKPLAERTFKVYHVLKQLGLVDFPAYGAFNVGADDTEREDLLKYFEDIPEFKKIFKSAKIGANPKTTIVRWVEAERRVITLVERAVRRAKKIPTTDSQGRTVYADGTDYYNYPGYDTPGGGVKDVKNGILFPYYGISRDTVEVNGLIPAAYYGVKNLLDEYGVRNVHGLMVWQKRTDEVELADEGPAFKNPRDLDQWIARVECAINQGSLWTGGGSSKEDPEGLLVLPLRGAFRVRGKNLNEQNYKGKKAVAIEKPNEALNDLTEAAYADYLSTVGDVYSKVEDVMKAKRGIENAYGKAAGTAKFMNTLFWYDFLDWTDYFTEEYRGKFGYAIDAHLTLARFLADTNTYEDRLIYSDKEWTELMRDGIDVVEEENGQISRVKITEGFIHLLPPYLKEKISVGAGKYLIDPIPVDKDRFTPAVLDLRSEGAHYKEKYSGAPAKQKPR